MQYQVNLYVSPMIIQNSLKYILLITLIFQCILHLAIPLMPHILNDSAWYYMYKEYVFDKTWVHEELYPSFHHPIMYYCSIGYPLLIYISELISQLIGCSLAFALLQLQFIFYLLSARLIWLICINQYSKSVSYSIVITYLWYIPFFNYAHLVMSESWFIFCLLATLYFFQKAIITNKLDLLAISFILAGYTFLVRPVAAIAFPLMVLVLFFQRTTYKNRKFIIITSILFFVFPISQSVFNRTMFSTWSIREGASWNLWNRVVAEGGYNPNTANITKQLRKKLKDSTFVPSNQHWWDITSQLSNYGMQPTEIQNYCKEVCFEGLKSQTLNYLSTSIKRGLWELPTQTQETVNIFSDSKYYDIALESYQSKHHAPLLKALNQQSNSKNSVSKNALKIYAHWNSLFLFLQFRWQYILLYLIFVFLLIVNIVEYYLLKKQIAFSIFIALLAIGMSLIACSMEVLHNRYYMPIIVLELIMLGKIFSVFKNYANQLVAFLKLNKGKIIN